MTTPIDMTGQRVGRYTILEYHGKSKWGKRLWKCRCDCGTIKLVEQDILKRRPNQSCGCLNRELSRERAAKLFRVHGLNRTPIQYIHASMMQRCFNPENEHYGNYGGRGIVPCEFVKASPANLIYLIGDRPSKELTLDRIKNDLGYYCGQCEECIKHKWPLNIQWRTRTEQNRNRRNNRYLWFNGEQKLIGDWAVELGQSEWAIRKKAGLIRNRNYIPEMGWSTEPPKI